MDIIGLDKDLNPLAYLQFINLQWHRRYYECGDFTLQISRSQYVPEIAYIYRPDQDAVAIVQKVDYNYEQSKRTILSSGFFYERRLWDKIMYPTFYANGNLEMEARRAVELYKADIPRLEMGDVTVPASPAVTWQELGGELGDVLYKRLQTYQMSQRCRYDYVNNKFYYEVWQGKDRTQAQTVNNYVVFSTDFGSIQRTTATLDSSNVKNFFVVAGAGEGADRIVEEVDLSGGKYRQQLFVDARDMNYDPEKQTIEEYRAALRERAKGTAIDYSDILSIDAEVAQQSYSYPEDYDLGDRCDINISDLGLTISARIIEIIEVYKRNERTVELVLGDKMLTDAQKVRLKG